MSTPQRFRFSSRGNIHTIWCVPKENYNNCDVIRQDVIRYSHADWLKRFLRNSSRRLTFCDLRRTCPHYRLAISKIRQKNFQNIARLTYKVCDAIHTCPPQVARPVYVECEQISSDLRSGEVWCGQGISRDACSNIVIVRA